MTHLPGTIDLGKFRVVYEEERERPSDGSDGYLLQQRAIIRLNEELVKLTQRDDYTVYCDDEKFKKQHGKRPSPLQYFIASIGFCMFSQFKRLATKSEVALDDLEMDLRMTYDLSGKFPIKDFSDAAQGMVMFSKSKARRRSTSHQGRASGGQGLPYRQLHAQTHAGVRESSSEPARVRDHRLI